MNKDIIPHVFGSLQTLERALIDLEALSGRMQAEKHSDLLIQYGKVLKNMRRIANKLQFEVASENWIAAVRSLKIFYGLHHMVRPDLLATLQNRRQEKELGHISIKRLDECPASIH